MNFPFVRQRDSMQCGIACLQMVCLHYGRRVSTARMEELCHATTEGVSLLGISDAARRLGFETVSVRTTVDALAEADLPCILHWNQKHFVVLYKVARRKEKCEKIKDKREEKAPKLKGDSLKIKEGGGTSSKFKDESLKITENSAETAFRFYVADPAKGLVTYTWEEFRKHWVSVTANDAEKGVAMFLDPQAEFFSQASSDGKEGDSASLSFLWKYAQSYKRQFLWVLLTLVVGSGLQLLMPFLTQGIVDWGISSKDIGLVWLILLGELVLVTGQTVTDFIRRWLLLHVSMRVNIALVSDFFVKLLKLPMAFFDTKLMGDLLQRMGDHGRVQSFLTGQALSVLFTGISFLVFGSVLFVYDRMVFLVFLVGSVFYGLWLVRFLGRRKVLDYELFEQQAINQNRTYQFVTSMQEIKLQNCEQRRREEWEQTQHDLFDVQLKSLRLQQTQEAGCVFINELKNILITVIAATAVIDGRLTLGGMLAVQYIVGQLNSPVEQLMALIYSLQDVRISLERINEIHARTDEDSPANQDAYAAIRHTYECQPKEIVLRDVCFKYDLHALRNTLTDISIHIPAGKVTAIVGASGSGKTTLVKLVLGYYPVLSGGIVIAGTNICDYEQKWWRRRCGVVMQDGVIFSESIERNIAVSDGEVDTDRLREAARIACIHDYIMSLPLRYNTRIGRDGVGLSQGQRQRILIARAVYRNPDFIFLDEATNALDAQNERAIVENLSQFYRGRTVVVVAHRLSTVRHADQIVVLGGGRVLETGTHQSLTQRHGAYYNLVKNQLELGG